MSLVDPDNRRPVDHALKREMLRSLDDQMAVGGTLPALSRDLLSRPEDGRIKLFVTLRALRQRRSRAALYGRGSYVPLNAEGSRGEHVCAFARQAPGDGVVVVAPRLVVRITGGGGSPPIGSPVWEETWMSLPDGLASPLENVLTGEVLEPAETPGGKRLLLSQILRTFPVALLVRVIR